MSHQLTGVRIKIDRARKNLADLEAAINAFEALGPHGVVEEKDSNTEHELYRYCCLIPIPIDWGAILGDCIHNLRCAFDHMAVELVNASGGAPTDYTAFPTGSSQRDFESRLANRINRLQSYCGGDGDAVWRLHCLDMADKHQLLIAAAKKRF